MPVPYLEQPPRVIPIDVGRQLFVDDFLIEKTDLKRTFHQPKPYEKNPVLRPDKPWEMKGRNPSAMVFSDGVWYDPKDELFKMWYMGGSFEGTCYARSSDGIHWEKPALDVEPGTNYVQHGYRAPLITWRDSATVWLDHAEKDPGRRLKMFTVTRRRGGVGEKRVLGRQVQYVLLYCQSPDGIHWSDRLDAAALLGDRTTVFYNPFRKVWVYSLRRRGDKVSRVRYYREHADAKEGLDGLESDAVPWVMADRLDPRNPNPPYDKITPELYNLDAVPYESLLVGFFAIWQGDQRDHGFRKRNEILLGFSRDGFHWHRPDRRPFLGVNETESAWNWGNVQSAGGGCLIVGDRLFFYFSGRGKMREGGHESTGLAMLRRDGFASLCAGREPGMLTTRPVTFRGQHLFVNVDADEGYFKAELLDDQRNVIQPFTLENSIPLTEDKTLCAVRWKGGDDLSTLRGKPVRFRFVLQDASLYSFWVSPDRSGASHGYVAAGGPGLSGATDTVGAAAYGTKGREQKGTFCLFGRSETGAQPVLGGFRRACLQGYARLHPEHGGEAFAAD